MGSAYSTPSTSSSNPSPHHASHSSSPDFDTTWRRLNSLMAVISSRLGHDSPASLLDQSSTWHTFHSNLIPTDQESLAHGNIRTTTASSLLILRLTLSIGRHMLPTLDNRTILGSLDFEQMAAQRHRMLFNVMLEESKLRVPIMHKFDDLARCLTNPRNPWESDKSLERIWASSTSPCAKLSQRRFQTVDLLPQLCNPYQLKMVYAANRPAPHLQIASPLNFSSPLGRLMCANKKTVDLGPFKIFPLEVS